MRYRGERALFLFQNLHRYTLYTALFILVCLWWEAAAAFVLDGRLGIGVGTVVMVINAALLSAYTFGCPFVAAPGWRTPRLPVVQQGALRRVAFTDLYVYLLSTGAVRDWNT